MTNFSNDAAGYLTSVVTPQGTIHYVYDAATGRLVETWTGTGAKSAATTDTIDGYDNQGRLASMTVVKQNGATPTLTSSNTVYYDAVGDSISTTLPTTLYLYDADGNVTKVAYPNGTETDTSLSGYWTPGTGGVFGTETITNKRGSTTLSSFLYSFDADRRKISSLETMTDPGEAATNTALTTWSYDSLSRLTKEVYDYGADDTLSGGAGLTTDDFTDTYTYDLDGNRILKTVDISNNGTIDQKIYESFNSDNQKQIRGHSYFSRLASGFLGRPRSRRVNSRPSCPATRLTHASEPNGRPRRTLVRTCSISRWGGAALTISTQSAGRGSGQLSGLGSSFPPRTQAHRLPHLQCSAFRTSPPRNALASTYRQSTRKCPSSWTTKLLKRP